MYGILICSISSSGRRSTYTFPPTLTAAIPVAPLVARYCRTCAYTVFG